VSKYTKPCWLCGYKLGGNSAKYNGHSVHIGCLQQHLKAKENMIQKLEALNANTKEVKDV